MLQARGSACEAALTDRFRISETVPWLAGVRLTNELIFRRGVNTQRYHATSRKEPLFPHAAEYEEMGSTTTRQ
jgi:hypothetical protein